MDNPVYEDNPFHSFGFEVWARDIIYRMYLLPLWLIIVIALLVAFSLIRQEALTFIIIGAATLLALAIELATSPTRYQIFKDRIKIVLGWIFHFDIPFSNIENATPATWKDLWGLNINFISGSSSNDILQITRKRGAKIHINPSDRDLFLENLNKALSRWRRSNKM